MSKRLQKTFATTKQQNRAALVTFTMAYDPDLAISQAVLNALPEAGVDIIELGMPFSDPMADGPAIQEAGIRALKAGGTLLGVLQMVRNFRATNSKTPIILMGYYNPILHWGPESFIQEAAAAGVDGCIIVDVPPEEDGVLHKFCKKHKVALIKLVTPTTDANRLQVILKKAQGFLYYVAVAGVTGTKSAVEGSVESAIARVRAVTDMPVVVGFGIKTRQDVARMAKIADAVVVGSALVQLLAQSGKDAALAFVRDLAAGVKK